MKRVLALLIIGLSFFKTASANNCQLDVAVGDNLSFKPSALQVSASECSTVTVNLIHQGSMAKQSMGHNWVLTTTADAQNVAQAGWTAGLANQYLPQDDARILAATDIIGGGESTSITFETSQLSVGGDYTFFCSFVGHFAVMKGKFSVVD
ncbi:MAG: azurin [Aestuariibacter sp.]